MEFENLDKSDITVEPVTVKGNEIKKILPFVAVGGLTYLYTKDVKKALAFGIGTYFVFWIGLMRSFSK